MTTDQLFLIFIIVEMIQMFLLLLSSRRTQKDIEHLVHDPEFGGQILSNGVHGFIVELQKDQAKQEAFFGLMALMGNAALQGIRGGGAAPKPVKLRGFAKILEPFINNGDVQNMVADKLASMVKATGEAGVEQAKGGGGW